MYIWSIKNVLSFECAENVIVKNDYFLEKS